MKQIKIRIVVVITVIIVATIIVVSLLYSPAPTVEISYLGLDPWDNDARLKILNTGNVALTLAPTWTLSLEEKNKEQKSKTVHGDRPISISEDQSEVIKIPLPPGNYNWHVDFMFRIKPGPIQTFKDAVAGAVSGKSPNSKGSINNYIFNFQSPTINKVDR